ncbi:hypothetical protein CC1G_05647 [Coprinopsis cinerea okayama7|uniref:Uncharacterized protein n=1 Tax=Coprinopsis cinerea (strain Okayama-7 / 130 / ATCC MYA-4618 / FGSC 9003) TaxID=240176 RepID=A8P1S5_COPC7|nr:hypothetical protein CC1G_05647 [Coprinopsis cinerea okayama7\|eukprot:XP_001838166.1 hypothetical protein CC1G_05647 [Coprinopsis cinerea okayama7\
MAGLLDVFSFVLTVGVIGTVVYGILYVVKAVNQGVESTKASLKERGLDVSSSGVSLKTSKHFDRQDYLDATQRGIVNLVEASSVRRADGTISTPASILRSDSSASAEERRRRKLWGKKKVDS